MSPLHQLDAPGIILCMHSANGWMHIQNDPCNQAFPSTYNPAITELNLWGFFLLFFLEKVNNAWFLDFYSQLHKCKSNDKLTIIIL